MGLKFLFDREDLFWYPEPLLSRCPPDTRSGAASRAAITTGFAPARNPRQQILDPLEKRSFSGDVGFV